MAGGLWVAALFAAIGGFLFGYDLGLIGNALVSMKKAFGFGSLAEQAIVGAAKIGAFFGTFLGGALMLHYGRRKAIAIDSIFFIAGPVIMAASSNVAGLIVGRVVVGLGVGISAAVVPAYLGEVAPAKVRGRIVETYELLLCIGMLSAALGDAAFQSLPGSWRWMVGAPVLPALLLSFSLCLLPESPRWLVISGRLNEALAVIHRMYTASSLPAGMHNSTAEVEEELLQLWSSVEKDREAAAARRQQHAERLRQRQEHRQTKVAPLSGSSRPAGASRAAASGGSAGQGGGPEYKGGWQRLQPAADEAGEEVAPESAAEAEPRAGGAAEAGAAGVQQRMEQAVVDLERGGGASAAAEDGTQSLLQGGGGSSSAAVGGGISGGGGRPSSEWPPSPLRVPAHLTPIRTSLSQQNLALQLQQQEQQQQEAGSQAAAGAAGASRGGGFGGGSALPGQEPGSSSRLVPVDLEAPAATSSSAQQQQQPQQQQPSQHQAAGAWDSQWQADGQAGGDGEAVADWSTQQQEQRLQGASPLQQQEEQQQVPVTARQGAGEAGFWRTLRDMLGDIYIVACGPERKALQVALWLAFFNQAFASTSIINYAPQLLERAGLESDAAAALLTAVVGASKLLGVLLSLFLVDSLGRRPLLLWGSAGCTLALASLVPADALHSPPALLAGMCAFIFAFSMSWAGVFWVLLSEIFSMSAKSPATSAATATLFFTGAVVDMLFITLHNWLRAFVFLLFALLAAASGVYVAAVVPEPMGKTLQEVQALLSLRVAPGSRVSGGGSGGWRPWRPARQQQEQLGLLPPGAVLSDAPAAAASAPGVELQQQEQ